MRVLIDARYLQQGRRSGIGRHVEALVRRVPRLDEAAQFILWTRPNAPTDLAQTANAHAVVVRAHPNGPRALLPQQRFFDFHDADVYHCPHNILGPGVPAASVVTVHDLMWLTRPQICDPRPWIGRARARFFANGIRRAIEHARYTLTVSRSAADEIVEVFPEAAKRIVITTNAPDPQFQPASNLALSRNRATALLGSDREFYLVVGQNQPSKGHSIAVQAFASVRPDAELVLVQRRRPGVGLDPLVRALGIETQVRWISEVTDEDLVSLLQSARALLQPSLHEGFGMPALEALACGCPVIASDIPPLREILAGAGLHCAPGSISSLAEQMRRLEDRSLRAELAARGPERAKAYDWDRSAKTALEVYRRAASRERG